MKYMGSKARIWKHIGPLILKNHKGLYVEPFCGGCNSLDKVWGERLGADNNFYLIEMWQALQQGWEPPDLVTEDMYNLVRLSPDTFEPAFVAYVGFSLSFGGKWFGGYRRDKAGTKGDLENMKTQSRRAKQALLKQRDLLKDVEFVFSDYIELHFEKATVYCDPPYAGTTNKYLTGRFDYDVFWNWVRYQSQYNNVFVSSYEAPPDFRVIWEKPLATTLSKQVSFTATEKLFKHDSAIH